MISRNVWENAEVFMFRECLVWFPLVSTLLNINKGQTAGLLPPGLKPAELVTQPTNRPSQLNHFTFARPCSCRRGGMKGR